MTDKISLFYELLLIYDFTKKEKLLETLEDKIRLGMDKYAGKENAPLTPIPEELTRPRPMAPEEVAEQEYLLPREPTISEIAEQQAKDALIRDSVDRYMIVRNALENCLMQAQHMRESPEQMREALKQIEQLAVGALQQ